jgi:FMN phosphatase YigB (HAD superfamily)
MKATILIDLDDTLLHNNMDTFLPTYLQGLGAHLHKKIDSKHLIESLLRATGQMVRKNLPAETLEQRFDAHFYSAIGTQKSDIEIDLRNFYSRKFPHLQSLTSQNPDAISLLQEFFRRGWDVVIATNPLFPRTAILQRLKWAGLPANIYPYLLVPSFEVMHFAKPHPAYYAELLSQIGWPDRPTFMIGNSLEDDIQPAADLGLYTYWVTDKSAKSSLPAHSSSGNLAQVINWIENNLQANLPPFEKSINACLAVLQSTPAALETRSANFSTSTWKTSSEINEWTPVEILCHLRDVDQEVNLPRIRRILEEDNPLLAGIDTDDWAITRAYSTQSGPDAMRGFMQARMNILNILMGLPSEAWQRPCRHTIFGRTTLAELVNFMATHDRNHIQQFCRTIECKQSTPAEE